MPFTEWRVPFTDSGVFRTMNGSRDASVRATRAHRAFEGRDRAFIPSIENPLLDALGRHQSRRDEHAHMLAHGRLAHAELLGDQEAAYAVGLEVAIDLRPENGASGL